MRSANIFENTKPDVFLMKYKLDVSGKESCLYEDEINSS